MDITISAIRSQQPVRPSFGDLKGDKILTRRILADDNHNYENYEKFEEKINGLQNVDVFVSSNDDFDLDVKLVDKIAEKTYSLNAKNPVFNYFGRYVVAFDNDIYYVPCKRSLTQDEIEKYGASNEQIALAAVENVAEELNEENSKGGFVKLFSRFHH